MSALIEWRPCQGQDRAKSYFLLTCAASRPQNLHTDSLCTSKLSKRRSSSWIFPAGNMKRNLCACRKGHKGMSNMRSGISLEYMKTLGIFFFFDSCQKPNHILSLCPCQNKTSVLNVNGIDFNVQSGSEVRLGAQLLCLVISDDCKVSGKTQTSVMKIHHHNPSCN